MTRKAVEAKKRETVFNAVALKGHPERLTHG